MKIDSTYLSKNRVIPHLLKKCHIFSLNNYNFFGNLSVFSYFCLCKHLHIFYTDINSLIILDYENNAVR